MCRLCRHRGDGNVPYRSIDAQVVFCHLRPLPMNPWRDLRKLPGHVWLVCAADFINRAGTMALVFLVPSLTLDRHWSLAMASLAISVYGVSRMVCGFITGTIID